MRFCLDRMTLLRGTSEGGVDKLGLDLGSESRLGLGKMRISRKTRVRASRVRAVLQSMTLE